MFNNKFRDIEKGRENKTLPKKFKTGSGSTFNQRQWVNNATKTCTSR
jgi:hypothetical protein